jgi:predicted ribosome quality control (RQC) complex YloA/Tae2 family protein
MAFDGITIAGIISEIKKKALGGRIDKIYQPEADEIVLNIRSLGSAYKLNLSANPSHPRLFFSDRQYTNPQNPPLFCMVLRKHLQSGKIIDITQPSFERIINIYVESLNEMGDYSVKRLILEVMGRHSNLILVDENDIVLDCAKHITHDKSSVREVLPGKKYELPPSQNKQDTLSLTREGFMPLTEQAGDKKLQALIYTNYTGISPQTADELCYRAGLDSSDRVSQLTEEQSERLYTAFSAMVDEIKREDFHPELAYDEAGKITDFAPYPMQRFAGLEKRRFDSMSELIEFYYAHKDFVYRMNQKTQDLKHLIGSNLERCARKKELQQRTLKEIEGRDTYQLYGELLTANIYSVSKGMTSVSLPNYYAEDMAEITIPLDGNLTPSENAQKYFKRYNKEKRTFVALQEQIAQNDEELEYLESVLTSVASCVDEQDIKDIREELKEQGYIKRIKQQKGMKSSKHSSPMHFVSDDGFHIYVGKNNKQNDELTLRFAKGCDIWLHTKQIPGSHVIIVTEGAAVPNTTLTQAATLAAYYSKGQTSSLVPVDYTEKRNVKKPNGSKPGFVIYTTNQTAYITPSEEAVNKIRQIK